MRKSSLERVLKATFFVRYKLPVLLLGRTFLFAEN
jgi:hypothetical protein